MPTPFVADAADEAVRSNSILNERKATDIIEETALEVDIRAWRADGLRLLQAASAREDHVPNGARRPCSVLGSTFFTLTCYTTIGYGSFTPQTGGGRGWTVFITLVGMIAAFPFFAAIGAILLILLNRLPITNTQMGVILVLALSLWFFLGALYFWQLDLPTPVLESIYPTHAPSTRRSNQDLIRAQDRRLAGILDRVILVLRDAVDARPRRLHPLSLIHI